MRKSDPVVRQTRADPMRKGRSQTKGSRINEKKILQSEGIGIREKRTNATVEREEE